MERYAELRNQYSRFFYRGFEVEKTPTELKITYHFEIEGLAEFAPCWTFPRPEGGGEPDEKLIFSLGLVELISYWKIACPPQVVVEAGELDEDQIRWWKHLYFNGLGEFFYVNNIKEADPEDFMEIRCAGREDSAETAAAWEKNVSARSISQGVLVPIGGGKDSVVTLDLLRRAGLPVYGYIINPRGATVNTAGAAGLGEGRVMSVRRTLDPNMLELNRRGYLNGHTPFSALVAFSSLIAARLLNLSYVALSNESSANESTVAGSTVNHQYSKSFEFEQDFHDYVRRYLPGNAYYFSLLRPLSEFQIAKYFAGLKQYHPIFRSCNAGSKTDSWCGHCPKCLFVYLILSPFLSREAVRDIFGRDMLEDETLKGTLDQLTGVVEEKPFECVGSRDEVNTAIVLTIGRLEQEHRPLPALLAYYKGLNLYETYQKAGDRYSAYCDTRNLLPDFLMDLVRKYCVETA
ncbi:hypothetical protein [Enterocloster asparagiformis]|uniref:hypothetical protein n=1 Tax=Enterocloster asparagiformis TaxID=333367 RepID=UPI000466605E|nr:hypothetical protein [Enterocloster asparagiformis]